MAVDLGQWLYDAGACCDAIAWVGDRSLDGDSAYDMWRKCKRPDWLSWILCKLGLLRGSSLAALAAAYEVDETAGLVDAVMIRRHIPWRTVKAELVRRGAPV